MIDRLKTIAAGWWWVVPIVLAAACAGAAGLDADILWVDEVYMLNDARVGKSLYGLARHISITNPWHVPGYFFLINLWHRLYDWTWLPFLIRVPALYAGILALAFVYRLGHDHFSFRIGLLTTLIVAVSNLFIVFLHEARMYSTNIMLTAFLMWWYLRIIDERKTITWKSYALLLVGFIAAIYTHYFMFTVLAGIGIFHLIAAPKNERYWRVIGVGVMALLSFIPWVFTLVRVLERMSVTGIPDTYMLNELLVEVGRVFSHGYVPLLIATMVLSLLAFRFLEGRPRFNFMATWSVLMIAVVVIVVGHEAIGIVAPDRVRYLVLLFPLFALIISMSFVTLPEWLPDVPALRFVPIVAVLVWCSLAVHSQITMRVTSDLKTAELTYPLHTVARALGPVHAPGDFALHVLPQDSTSFFYNRTAEFYNEVEGLALNPWILHINDLSTETATAIDQIGQVGDISRANVWLAYMAYDQEAVVPVQEAITAQTAYSACQSTLSVDGAIINQFTQHPVCCSLDAAASEPLVTYDTMALSGVGVETAADDISVWVATTTESDYPPDAYSVGVYVVAEDGSVPAQIDYGLPSDDFACRNHTLSTEGLADGSYSIMTSVYDWRTGQRIVGENNIELPQVGTLTIDNGAVSLSSGDIETQTAAQDD